MRFRLPAAAALPAILGALVAVSLATEARACSQCLCGTPFPADVLGGVVPSQLTLGLEERYLSKSNALDEGLGTEEAREHRISGFVLWRPANRLALMGKVPYNSKELTEHPDGEASSSRTTNGLGDAEVLALVGLVNGAGTRSASVGLVLGFSAPTGSNDEKDAAGERLDAHLQPGSGAWCGTAGLNLSLSAPRGSWSGSVVGRLNDVSSHGYRYGRTLLYNVGYNTPALGDFLFRAEVNGRTAARDRFEDGSLGEHTGGTVVYAAPGVRWVGGMGLSLDATVQIPVVQSLNGDQTENTTGRVALSWGR